MHYNDEFKCGTFIYLFISVCRNIACKSDSIVSSYAVFFSDILIKGCLDVFWKARQKVLIISSPSGVLHPSALGPLPNCTKTTKTFRWMFDLGCINVIICCLIPHFALFVLVHLRSTPCAVVVQHLRSTGLEVLDPNPHELVLGVSGVHLIMSLYLPSSL